MAQEVGTVTADGGELTLSLHLLGGFALLAGHLAVVDRAWSRRKAKAILKLLALQPDRSLHRDRLLEILWPALQPQAAANNLRKNLHYLRAAATQAGVQVDLVSSREEMLTLHDAIQLDIDDFRWGAQAARTARTDASLYEQALACYGGELLPMDLYEDWSQQARRELRELRNQLLLEVGRLYATDGRFDAAAERLHQLLRTDPVHEEAHRALMLAYANAGNRERALRQYKQCRDALRRELEVEPSEETKALRLSIQEDTPFAARNAHSIPSANGSAADPHVRYARTADGLRIAYFMVGAGPPLLETSQWMPHGDMMLEWRMPEWRSWYERLASAHTLIRYDARGTGLSDPWTREYSADALALDIEAVVDALGLETLALLAHAHIGPAAVAYAAKEPARVERLVLWCSYARGAAFYGPSHVAAMRQVLETDWELYIQSVSRAALDWRDSDLASRYSEFLRRSATQEVALSFVRAIPSFDVTHLLPRVTAQTLVVHFPEAPWLDLKNASELTDSIPAASLVLMKDPIAAVFGTDQEAAARVIEEFLDDPAPHQGRHSRAAEGVL